MTDRAAVANGLPDTGRVEAFSDGVVAIIVTIMVLELHPPVADGLDRLWGLWPVFLAYLLSFAYVAIYWINHHRLFAQATRATNALIWSNMVLLFTLSLVPFSTAYLGEHHFSREATWLYLVTMILPAFAYSGLHAIITRTGRQDAPARRYYSLYARKGLAAVAVYALGMILTAASPWAGITCAALVALFWCLPTGRVDRLFAWGGQTA